MRRACCFALLAAAIGAPTARAQTAPDLVRFEWLSGVLFQGSMADAYFQLDTTPFGGILIERDGGSLDVDPSFYFGVGASYRLSERLQVRGAWLHSEGRYRVQFPAESRDEGNFDLEALLLAGFDFQGGGVESAMSFAKTDVYMVTAQYEVPVLGRWLFPFASVGGGLFRQRSDGSVFDLQFEGEVPPAFQIAERAGINPLQSVGISIFSIDATDVLASVGGGIRASLSPRWGVEVQLEDLIRVSPDLQHIDATSTPPPDVENFRLYQTRLSANDGMIHNIGVRAAFHYALWPYGAPR